MSNDLNRSYCRTEINFLFTKVKAKMHQQAIAFDGDGRALYTDCYTGNTLRGGDRYDYEHIRSSEEIFMIYRDRLTNHEIAEVVNCPENVAVTLRTINQSKGKLKLEEWLKINGNVSKHGINKTMAIDAAKLADRGIKNKVIEILSRK
ncbi:hypothetical protein GCM10023115_28170 [Pontixanthobacter gangjinensis]|uniref:Uncharacterized protein n=1 Tax=Christiangramia aestuarii TaxID=1028746 RepID=A0A7K1LML1_9FLAO|nr:hypothetical protein [Christiangramia aestuarii]MUP42049.1 hypothetical protein [Christiangramia aestuarii]